MSSVYSIAGKSQRANVMNHSKNKKKTSFEIYRYQIIPQNRFWTPEFFVKKDYKSIDDLISNKNNIFSDVLKDLPSIKQMSTNRSCLTCQLLSQKNQEYLFEFAVERKLLYEKKDFIKETLTNWPSFKVFIWNDPEHQYAVVQKRIEAFANTRTIISALNEAINQQLKKDNLCVYFEALFEERSFWDTVSTFKDALKEVRFELITPNMSNIASCLTDDLKDLAKDTNSCKMTVSLMSDNDSSLKLDGGNQNISGMLNYASSGGGNITFRAKKVKRLIKTNNSIKHFELDDVEVNSASPDQLVQILKGGLQ